MFNPTALSSLERNRPHRRPNVAQIGTQLQDFLGCSLLLLLGGCTAPPPPFVPQVNEPTTHIVEPLDEAGLVDYLEAANQRLAKGVSPEDNWEVVVRRAFGPLDWDEASDAEYYRRLGIPPVPAIPENGNYYQPPCPDTNETELEKKRQDQFWDAMERPWRASEFPEFAQWLNSQDSLSDRLVAGSHVSRHYIPRAMSAEAHAARTAAFLDSLRVYEESSKGIERWSAALFKDLAKPSDETAPLSRWHVVDIVQQSRAVCRVLRARALLRIGQGDTAGAKSDLFAIHRIARLFCQGMASEWAMGNAFEGMACDGDAKLLQSGNLTRDSCESYLSELSRLTPLEPTATLLDTDCRHVGLDAMQFAASKHREMFEMLESDEVSRSTRAAFAKVDWNEAMRLFNERCDTFVKASRERDMVRRLAQTEKIGGERLPSDNKELANEMERVAEEAGDLTKFWAKVYFDRYMVNLNWAEVRQQAHLRVVRTAYAAELYRFDHGSYPRTIESLRPILNEVPIDPLSGKPVRLAVTDDDIVIYSVGRNQIDDGGLSIGENSVLLGDDHEAIRLRR